MLGRLSHFMKTLISGKFYTIIRGDYIGVTGKAIGSFDGDSATHFASIDLPQARGQFDGPIDDLREATADEESLYVARAGRHSGGH